MLKLAPYFKKSILPILLVFGLLWVQAACDLALPEYTSTIVNIGIQQNGVEHVAPDVIRQTQMERLKLFMSDEDYRAVLEHYTLLDPNDLSGQEYQKQVKKYPALETESLYQLNKPGKEEYQKLDSLLSKPLLLLETLSADSEQTRQIKEQMMQSYPSGSIPENASIVDLMASMQKDQLQQMLAAINEKFEGVDDNILSQKAVAATQAEYEAVGVDTSAMQTKYIVLAGLRMLAVALGSMIATILVTFLASRVAAQAGRDLRAGVFRKVVGFSSKEFDEFSTASLITRCTNDIQQIQMLVVMLLRMVFYAPIIGVGGFIKVLGTNGSMSWVIGLAVLAIMALVVFLFTVAMPKFKIMQKLVDKVNLVAREILTGLPVIRAFHTERHEEERFDAANRELTKTNLFVNRVMSCMMPAMMFIMNAVCVLIIWVGADGVDQGAMQVGDLLAFIQYTMQIIMAFLMLSMLSIILPRASVSARRVAEVLGKEVSVQDPEQTESFEEAKKGLVEFRHVSFRYPDAEEDVLTDISFTARPGETTAFIGSTGSGKSTLINLIPRFFDVTEGEILIDGVDIRKVGQHELREKIGYVPQKGVLFSGTVESNIKYSNPDLDDEQMKRAAEVAQASGFIEEKPDGYSSEIAQGGTNVSGGQKQRLSIARAIAKNPEIYIFDDSFSALDYKTDATLRSRLKAYTKDSTVFIVAQRISTVLNAEQIIVLDEGKIAGMGTHRQLMESCEEYRQIALSQLSEEEAKR